MCKSISLGLIIMMGASVMMISSTGRGVEPCCTVEDIAGTAGLPPAGCMYQSYSEPWEIVDGLPEGTTIELDVTLRDFVCCNANCPLCTVNLPPGECETEGGVLGGHAECFESTLQLEVRGTGDLADFRRTLSVPVFCEVHTGPRSPGDPVQTFSAEMYRFQGELFGDPDFCTLRVRAGQALGLPSPGETTLTKQPSGDFAVDSFFDITYEIEFEGCPASLLEDLSGTTKMTGRISICEEERVCEPLQDGSACEQTACPEVGDECQPTCVNFDAYTGEVTITDCDCRGVNECHVDISQVDTGSYCTITSDGGLPPIGCEYTSPKEKFLITGGLPPGTTIQMEGTHGDFACCENPCELCSITLLPGDCEGPGGNLGGDSECFESTLDLQVRGTGELGNFTRHLSVPVFCEVHTGARNPDDAEQTFATEMFRLEGELFGDPDFCMFRIVGGSSLGLPSPGQTTLTQLPSGDFAVDSFFDISYRIEFAGCPGSVLQRYQGATVDTIRMQTGRESVFPSCVGACPDSGPCEETQVANADGTVDICCDCEYQPAVCEPTPDGLGCTNADCGDPNLTCLPKVVRHNIPRKLFPPGGQDIISPTSGYMELQYPTGQVITISVLPDVLPNTTVINRTAPEGAGDRRWIDVEIVEMELSGEDGTIIRLNDIAASTGQVIGSPDPGMDFPAESFFDVFVEVDLPGMGVAGLQHATPIRLEASVDRIPPLGTSLETPDGWSGVSLLDSAGNPTGFTIRRVVHIMPPPPPEWEVVECECMEHEPGHTYTVDDEDCPECADLNCDDEINFEDFSIMALQWITGCPE